MTVTIRLFAFYADQLGRKEIELDLEEGATIDHAIESIRSLPGGSAVPEKPLVAINRRYARSGTILFAGDELAVIPPVAGG